MVRFNILTQVMKGTLSQLKKAVKGLVVMSSALEAMYSCFLFQQVPAEWENAAYPSLMPLARWVEDLFQRLAFVQSWLVNGPPSSFWISGFFFPQGFMTGALQMHARKTQVAIDALDFWTRVMPFFEDSVPSVPENGVYIYGLFLEGARWNIQKGMLDEMMPGVLTSRMPCMWLEPILAKALDPGTCYKCPFYKTSRRAGTLSTTGHSTNYITLIYLPSDKSEDHWIRRGLAALSMPD
jgi:dynein heavy chain